MRSGVGWRKEWSIAILRGPSLDRLSSLGRINPVISRRDVDDVAAKFVADPFMIPRKDGWWMFFEVMNSQRGVGEIGVACSGCGLEWDYCGIVLKEPFHLAYPYVFEHDDEIWMIPASPSVEEVRLYRALRFPSEWTQEGVLLRGVRFRDSTVWPTREGWWMLTSTRVRSDLRLYCAPGLRGRWEEHPGSPLAGEGDMVARPGGRVVEDEEGRLVRWAQDGRVRYGGGIRGFRVRELSLSTYRDEAVPSLAIGASAVDPWRELGIHTIDAHRTRSGWVACVDGLGLSRRVGRNR